MCPRLLSTSWNSDSTALDQFPPWEAAIKTGLKHPQSTHFFVIDKSLGKSKHSVFSQISGIQRSNLRHREPTGLLWAWKRGFGDDPEDPDWDPVRDCPVRERALRQPCGHPSQPSDHAGEKKTGLHILSAILLCVSLGSLDGQCCWSILGKCNNNVGMIGKWSGKQSMEGVGSVLATKPTPAKSNWQIINQPLPWLPVWLVTTGSAKKTGTARNIHIGVEGIIILELLLIEIPNSVRV